MIIVTVQQVDSFGHVQLTNVYTLEPHPDIEPEPNVRERLQDYIKAWAQAYRR